MRIGPAVAVATLVALATAAVAFGASPDASGGSTPGPQSSAAAAVSIIQKSFQPAQVTVNVGETVTWTVTEGINEPHSVTSGNATDATTGTEFDSGLTLKNNGDTFSHTFANAGSFSYFCVVHPDTMTGTVTVLAAGQTVGPSAPAASVAPPSAVPSAAASPAGSAAASGAPAEPARAPEPPVDPMTKLISAGILVLALLVLFGWGAAYRRMNPRP